MWIMAQLAVTERRLPSRKRIAKALEGLRPSAPVVIMLHGFKYDPGSPAHHPERTLYARAPDPAAKRARSWPRAFALRGANALAIGFSWRAKGTIWQAHHRAKLAGESLALLITRINEIAPGRPVHIVAHSLGVRVVLTALSQTPQGAVSRVIMIAGAAFESELAGVLQRPASRSTEFFNIRSRANTLFDLLLRAAFPHWGVTIGRGRLAHPRLLQLDIDAPQDRQVMAAAGLPLDQTSGWICHWSGYLRRDVCALYRDLIHRPDKTPFASLRASLIRHQRLSRLAPPRDRAGLPA